MWGTAAGGPPESFFIEWRPPALKVLGKRAGALIFAGGGVYRWKETVGKAETLNDCDEAWNPPEVPNPRNRTLVPVKGAKLIRLDAPDEIELSAFPRLDGASSYENRLTIEASVGAYVFFNERSEEIYCMAAHNSWSYLPQIYDLATRKSVQVTKDDEQLLRVNAQNLSKKALRVVRRSRATGQRLHRKPRTRSDRADGIRKRLADVVERARARIPCRLHGHAIVRRRETRLPGRGPARSAIVRRFQGAQCVRGTPEKTPAAPRAGMVNVAGC